MWDYDEFVAKAVQYFRRGADHPSNDDEFALWMLLGVEFLLRSPLARVSPALLATADGPSILHAVGVVDPKADPKSVPLKTVIERLQKIAPEEFTSQRAEEAAWLSNLRNAELHTSSRALADVPPEKWLPRFVRVVEAISRTLNKPAEELLSSEVLEQGRRLIDAADKRLTAEVRRRIELHKASFNALRPEEKEHRLRELLFTGSSVVVSCPACSNDGWNTLEVARWTKEKLVDDKIVYERVSTVTSFNCAACDLVLRGSDEIAAAGLEQQYTDTLTRDVSDQYGADDVIDYGHETN